MNKKQYLELLIKSFGLKSIDVSHYRTDGCDGQFGIGIGWKGTGIDNNNNTVINFHEPDGFNMAVFEIIRQATKHNCKPTYISKP